MELLKIAKLILEKEIKTINHIGLSEYQSININGVSWYLEEATREFQGAIVKGLSIEKDNITIDLDLTNAIKFEITKKQKKALNKFNSKVSVNYEDLEIQQISKWGNVYMMLRDGEATRDIRNILTSLKGYEGTGQKHISKGAQRAIYYLLKAFDIEYKI